MAFRVVLSLINMSGEHLAWGKMSPLIKAEKSRFAVQRAYIDRNV